MVRKLLLITLLLAISVSFTPARASGLPVRGIITLGDEYYSIYMPIVIDGNFRIDRFVSGGFPFYPEEWEYWCSGGYPCTQADTLDSFTFRAPPDRVVAYVRLYLAFWDPPNGAHIIYPYDGCAEKVCVRSLQGSLAAHTATLVEVYIDSSLPGWGGPVHLADFSYLYWPYQSITVVGGKYYDPSFPALP